WQPRKGGIKLDPIRSSMLAGVQPSGFPSTRKHETSGVHLQVRREELHIVGQGTVQREKRLVHNGSNRVTRSSPGAWLILRPDGCTWKPWGRLEAWREAGYSFLLGYRFELFQDGVATVVSASSSISLKNGGSFVIDVTGGTNTAVSTPTTSPQGSCDLGSGSWSEFGYLLPQHPAQNRGFVMSASVEGVGKRSKPEVEVAVTHVTCTEDAAAHVALAAAVDLSLDACKLFSHKLRKELRQQSQLGVV
ncbi:unnamed protein product, partial [Brassica rapa]